MANGNELNFKEFQKKSMDYFESKLNEWESMGYINGDVTKVKDIYTMRTLLNALSEEGKCVIMDVGKHASADYLERVEKIADHLDFFWHNSLFISIRPKEMIIHRHNPNTNYVALIAESGKFINREFESKNLENVIMLHPKGSIYTPAANYPVRLAAMNNLLNESFDPEALR